MKLPLAIAARLMHGELTPAQAFGLAAGRPVAPGAQARDIAAEWHRELPAMLDSADPTIRGLAEAHCRAVEGRSDLKRCEVTARRRRILDTWQRVRGATP